MAWCFTSVHRVRTRCPSPLLRRTVALCCIVSSRFTFLNHHIPSTSCVILSQPFYDIELQRSCRRTARHNAEAHSSVPERHTWRLKFCSATEAETGLGTSVFVDGYLNAQGTCWEECASCLPHIDRTTLYFPTASQWCFDSGRRAV